MKTAVQKSYRDFWYYIIATEIGKFLIEICLQIFDLPSKYFGFRLPIVVMNLYVDFLGYMGTLLVFVSMTMNSMQKLRLLNILGSVFTIVYSIIISAFPIVLLNLGLALLNAYKILTEKKKGEQ